MDSVYIKLVAPSHISNRLGLVMDKETPYRYGKNYLSLEIPVRLQKNEQDNVIKRGQHVFVEPCCTINVKGNNIVEVEPNPELAEFGSIQGGYKVHPESGLRTPGFYFTSHKQIDLSTLAYCVRLYLLA